MITVLGASGFIGSNIVGRLEALKYDFYAPKRGVDVFKTELGDIMYCIGLTADFRQKPFETVEAHVCLLSKILQYANFKSLTYLSSTRVYIKSKDSEVFEHSPITVSLSDPDELYTLTKLTGESICLSSGKKTRIVRLSNVYGNDYTSQNFITDILKKVQTDKYLKFYTSADSSKDYISIDDISSLLIDIARNGQESVYNVASGMNISNREIVTMLKESYPFNYEFDEHAKEIIFPKINIDKIKKEFGFSADSNKVNLSNLIKNYGNDTDRRRK